MRNPPIYQFVEEDSAIENASIIYQFLPNSPLQNALVDQGKSTISKDGKRLSFFSEIVNDEFDLNFGKDILLERNHVTDVVTRLILRLMDGVEKS